MLLKLLRSNPHGWIIVGVTFVTLSAVFSARGSLGLLMPTWEQELGWTRKFISGGGATMLVMMAAVAPVAGNLLDRFGPRLIYGVGLLIVGGAVIVTGAMIEPWQFIVAFSLFGGIGFGIIGVPLAATTISHYFEKGRSTAVSIGTAGVGAGQLLVMPLLAAVIGVVGWRTSFFGFGTMIVALGVLTMLTIRVRPAHGAGHAGASAVALAHRLRLIFDSPAFWLMAFGYVICGFTTTGVIKVHLLPYAAACGFPPLESAAAYGLLSGIDAVGMVLAGYLADRVNRPVLLGSIYILRALSFLLLMIIARDLSLLFVFAVVFGMLDFATIPVIASLVASHLGLRVMGLTMGLLTAVHALGGAAGAYLGGWLFDLFQQYDWVWIISLILAMMAGLASLCIRPHPTEGPGHTPAAATA